MPKPYLLPATDRTRTALGAAVAGVGVVIQGHGLSRPIAGE
jgi:hypothetical protein